MSSPPALVSRTGNWLTAARTMDIEASNPFFDRDAVGPGGHGGYYQGNRRARSEFATWLASGGDANADILPDLDDLRRDSRDLIRTNPIAQGAVHTLKSFVVGTGIRPLPNVDFEALGISEDEAREKNAGILRQWKILCETAMIDSAGHKNIYALQNDVIESWAGNGESFWTLPMLTRTNDPYHLRVQGIEADRIRNKDNVQDTESLIGGIFHSARTGEALRYHVMDQHPGSLAPQIQRTWTIVNRKARRSGRTNLLHVFSGTRPGQARGVPMFAPVIAQIKQVGRFIDADLMAAVLQAKYTGFITTEAGGEMHGTPGYGGQNQGSNDDDFIELGNGTMVSLATNEKITFADPTRPNVNVGTFVDLEMKLIGMALAIPFEVLVQVFNSNYSAARASLLRMWATADRLEAVVNEQFNKPIYCEMLMEAVARGYIDLPGFLEDPFRRAAWCRTQWLGPTRAHIDPQKEALAAQLWVDLGASTLDREAQLHAGVTYEELHAQRVREVDMRKRDGIEEFRNGFVRVTDDLETKKDAVLEGEDASPGEL